LSLYKLIGDDKQIMMNVDIVQILIVFSWSKSRVFRWEETT